MKGPTDQSREEVAMHPRLWTLAGTAILGWMAWNGPQVQAQSEVPEPAPTNAVQAMQRTVVVEGTGNLPLSGDSEETQQQAYQAAVLEAYQQLFWKASEQLGWIPNDLPVASRSFRLDANHPSSRLLDWILRSEVLQKKVQGSRVQVTVESPPLAELNESTRHVVRQFTQDLDGDGRPETVAVYYDGHIEVLKNTSAGFKVLASTPTLNVFQCATMRGSQVDPWNQVQLTRVTNLRNSELVGPGKLRMVADLTLGEMVDRHWIGKATEQREVFLRWNETTEEPAIEISEPGDFLYTRASQVAWRGLLKTPAGLHSARLKVNGRPFWETPPQLTSKRLKMDILLPLLPGINRAQIHLSDQQRRSLGREVLLYREAPCPPLIPERRRALLIGVDSYAAPQFSKLPRIGADLQRLKSALVSPVGAFAAERVEVLQGSKATRNNILQALAALTRAEGEDRVFVFVYFAGLSSGSAQGSSKGLLPYDARGFDEGAVLAKDLLAAVGELRQQDLVLAVDTSHPDLTATDKNQLWLDSQEFSERLAHQGWAVLCSVDSPLETRDGAEGSRFLTAFLEGLSSRADSNGDGYIEWEENYRGLFQALRVQSPNSPPPLRRGDVLGRVPLARTLPVP